MMRDAILVVAGTLVLLGLMGSMEMQDQEVEAKHTQEVKELARADAKRLAAELRMRGLLDNEESMGYPIASTK